MLKGRRVLGSGAFLLLAFLITPLSGWCTIELPDSDKQENIAESFNLGAADRIEIKYSGSRAGEEKTAFISEVTNKEDIKIMVGGFADCRVAEISNSPYGFHGSIAFFSGNAELVKLNFTFHYHTPLFFKGADCYIVHDGLFAAAFYKYLPEQKREDLLRIKKGIREGTLH